MSDAKTVPQEFWIEIRAYGTLTAYTRKMDNTIHVVEKSYADKLEKQLGEVTKERDEAVSACACWKTLTRNAENENSEMRKHVWSVERLNATAHTRIAELETKIAKLKKGGDSGE